ncbi:alanyl-tRNA editing protein Aarsd1-B [Drosophila guanche]|uniref:Blast:Alanyl-tRNA editing protein Aarsd1-B n=1 Tax=Drosophila guanche TaxID=7266 RepID=A0A3B0JXR2_DROGU|nr:alanyl-tRNA editing protein Aarsd1-B [Drosophila guanche]SPP86855.1 blast:Alanyl-tRNA editing protein Aarsd1-B [Drosophila guanche]
MVFKCQEDSFLKQYTTKIVSCEYATLDRTDVDAATGGEVRPVRGFNVVCEDTILFPEGGGQPCDYGTINGQPVRSVLRKGATAVHFVESSSSFEEGAEVHQSLDWDRRLDHMQQHSGQHLITALFDREFKYDTTSWSLGSNVSYIQLNTPHLISRESLDLIERQANELIREGRPVSVVLVDPKVDEEFSDARAARGLPKDHEGLARVVRIEGVESNMCCGTHVTDLSQLQCIKLLYAEKVKTNVLVHFVVGVRVLRKLGEVFQREQQLTVALKGGAQQHLELVQKLQQNVKGTRKAFLQLLKDFATAEAERLDDLSKAQRPKYFSLHRRDGIEVDFIHTFLRHAPEDIFYFLTVSEGIAAGSSAKGHLVLRGDPELVKELGPQFLELLEGKGNGKEGSFQGKINNLAKLPECIELLESHFKPKKTIEPKPVSGS